MAAFEYVNMSNFRTERARSAMCGSKFARKQTEDCAPGGQQQRNDSEHAECEGVLSRRNLLRR